MVGTAAVGADVIETAIVDVAGTFVAAAVPTVTAVVVVDTVLAEKWDGVCKGGSGSVFTANGVPVFERDGGAGPVVVGPFEFTSKVCGIFGRSTFVGCKVLDTTGGQLVVDW